MSPSARGQYVRRMQTLYRDAKGRKAKSRLLDQVCQTLGRGRRQAKRLMRCKEPPIERPFRHRQPVYPERLIRILAEVWAAAQHVWSVRLRAALPLWMPAMEGRWTLSARERRQLLDMSPATMDRRLAAYKKQVRTRVYGKTRPARWLRQNIPIHTEWPKVTEPGWVEVDTVSHSGPSAAGLFAYTLDETDLFSGWTEVCAMLGKPADKVVAAADEIRRALPFELKGLDSDNGEEFINYELDRYCRGTGVRRFRSRAYKKDDQAHIEQKNGTHVRQLIGWHRYDTQAAVSAMNDLYRNEWRLLTNLFLPSIKLDYKTRNGSRLKRVYEEPRTPLDRLVGSGLGDRAKLEELRRLRQRLNPFDLSRAVDRKLDAIWKLASNGKIAPAPPPHATKSNRPWEWWLREEDAKLAQFPFRPDRDLFRISQGHRRDSFFGTH